MGRKMVIEIYGEGKDVLEEMSKKEGIPKEELITRALRLYRFLENEVFSDKEKKKLAILNNEGKIEKEIEP